jgi:hypothetical protein
MDEIVQSGVSNGLLDHGTEIPLNVCMAFGIWNEQEFGNCTL